MTITVHTDTDAPDLRVERLEVIHDRRDATAALDAAVGHLRGLQDPAGWWKGELETNVTMDAEDLLLREFLGIRTAAGDRAGGALDPLAAARGRHLGQLLRRPRRPVDDRSRPTSRCGSPATPRGRAAHACGAGVRPGQRRPRTRPGLHPSSGWRCSARGRGTTCPSCRPRSIYLPQVVPVQRLRLGLLGPADRRAAHHRRDAAAGAAAAVRPRRAAHRRRRCRRWRRRSAGPASSSGSTSALHAYGRRRCGWLRRAAMRRGVRVDPGPPGGRRLVGRHPAAVGLLDPGAAPDGLPARPPGGRRRDRAASTAS